jgi:hypothetical protein
MPTPRGPAQEACELVEELVHTLPKDLKPGVLLYVYGDTRILELISSTRERLMEFALLAEGGNSKKLVLGFSSELRELQAEIENQHSPSVLLQRQQDWSRYDALVEGLRRQLEAVRKLHSDCDGLRFSNEVLALILLVKQPGWSIAQIAKEVGVSRNRPYRWKRFMQAWNAARRRSHDLPRGFKTREGNIEAFSD